MVYAHPTNAAGGAGISNRWVQLVIGIVCMTMVANLQYGWTLFVNPIQDAMQWKKAAIQVAFTLFVLLETWLVPVEGWLAFFTMAATVRAAWLQPAKRLAIWQAIAT